MMVTSYCYHRFALFEVVILSLWSWQKRDSFHAQHKGQISQYSYTLWSICSLSLIISPWCPFLLFFSWSSLTHYLFIYCILTVLQKLHTPLQALIMPPRANCLIVVFSRIIVDVWSNFLFHSSKNWLND